MRKSPHRRVRYVDHDDHQQPDLNPRAIFGGNSGVSAVALAPAGALVVPGDSLSSDLLVGCSQISQYVFGKNDWPTKKKPIA